MKNAPTATKPRGVFSEGDGLLLCHRRRRHRGLIREEGGDVDRVHLVDRPAERAGHFDFALFGNDALGFLAPEALYDAADAVRGAAAAKFGLEVFCYDGIQFPEKVTRERKGVVLQKFVARDGFGVNGDGLEGFFGRQLRIAADAAGTCDMLHENAARRRFVRSEPQTRLQLIGLREERFQRFGDGRARERDDALIGLLALRAVGGVKDHGAAARAVAVDEVFEGGVGGDVFGLHGKLRRSAHREAVSHFDERETHGARALDLQYDGTGELQVAGHHESRCREFAQHIAHRSGEVLIATDRLPAVFKVNHFRVTVAVREENFDNFVVGHGVLSKEESTIPQS